MGTRALRLPHFTESQDMGASKGAIDGQCPSLEIGVIEEGGFEYSKFTASQRTSQLGFSSSILWA